MQPTEQIPTLFVNSQKLKDSKTVADAFNNFFFTVTGQLNVKNLSKGDAILFLQDSFPENFPSLKIIPTIASAINYIIHSLNENTLHAMMK